jgi:hypothetical protein
MKKFLLILIIPLFSFGQVDLTPKDYISVGFLDHKTGTSIFGYTRTIIQNDNNEIFVGLGTSIAINTLVVGLKKYLLRSFIDGYSVISIQSIYGMGGGFKAPAISIGVEKKIWKQFFVNMGFNTTIRIYTERTPDFISYPHLNINVRF